MINYIFQTILISTILSISYFLLFRKSKQFQTRRALVLAIPIFSFLIPFSNHINFENNPVRDNAIFSQVLGAVNTVNPQSQSSSSLFSLENTFLIIYISIALAMLLLMLYRVFSILRLRNEAKNEKGVYIVNNEYQAFSFFNLIFIPSTQLKNIELIIEHEKAHVNQYHSIDIMYFEILKIVLWFNPIIYLLRKEISAIHEFTADQVVIEKQIDVEQYFNVLMENMINNKLTVSNNFNNSLTKNRFIMMKNFNIKERLLFRLIGMAIIVSSMTIVFQACENDKINSETPKEKELVGTESQKTSPEGTSSSDKVKEVDVYPTYPGGDKERFIFMQKNTKYPESAIKDSIQGMVYVNFIVSKDGNLKELKVLRGISPEVDAEALRVVSIMPKWNPAEKDGEKVDFKFTIPFRFALK